MNNHKHQYEKIGIARVTKVENPDYAGAAGDKAFLMRVCKCGDMRAFEYGRTKDMEDLKESLAFRY